MPARLRDLCALAALLALLAPMAAAAGGPDDFVEDNAFLRVTIGGQPARLEALVLKRADASGRLPIAVIAHGKESGQAAMLAEHAADYRGIARDLARRGWLAVVAMRRGFGQSDGPGATPASCESKTLTEYLDGGADDLAATLEAVAKRDDADPTRAIAIGSSAGGAAVVAWTARNPPNLLGAVDISGGIRFETCPLDEALVAAFKEYGTKSRVPSLWMYARNDELFPPALVTQLHAAFLGGGADVKLVRFGDVRPQGHRLFMGGEGRLLWLTELDAFLRFRNLPTWPRQDIDALMTRIKLKPATAPTATRVLFERYWTAPSEKALAQALPSKAFYYNIGASSIDAARKSVVDYCQKQKTGERCVVMMENQAWVGEPFAPQ